MLTGLVVVGEGVAVVCVFWSVLVTFLDVVAQLRGLIEREDYVLHMVSLAFDQAAEMKHNAARLVALSCNCCVGMLEG